MHRLLLICFGIWAFASHAKSLDQNHTCSDLASQNESNTNVTELNALPWPEVPFTVRFEVPGDRSSGQEPFSAQLIVKELGGNLHARDIERFNQLVYFLQEDYESCYTEFTCVGTTPCYSERLIIKMAAVPGPHAVPSGTLIPAAFKSLSRFVDQRGGVRQMHGDLMASNYNGNFSIDVSRSLDFSPPLLLQTLVEHLTLKATLYETMTSSQEQAWRSIKAWFSNLKFRLQFDYPQDEVFTGFECRQLIERFVYCFSISPKTPSGIVDRPTNGDIESILLTWILYFTQSSQRFRSYTFDVKSSQDLYAVTTVATARFYWTPSLDFRGDNSTLTDESGNGNTTQGSTFQGNVQEIS